MKTLYVATLVREYTPRVHSVMDTHVIYDDLNWAITLSTVYFSEIRVHKFIVLN